MRRFAIVTGASRGIGAAVANTFVARGIPVLGIARSAPGLGHPLYEHVRLDLSATDRVQSYFEHIFAHVAPHIDADQIVLVNNSASVGTIDTIEAQSLSAFHQAIALNVTVPIWLMGFVSRCFPKQSVRIINMSSGAAAHPYAGMAGYCASKAALLMAARVFAKERALIEQQTGGPAHSVAAFAPGSVDTDIQTRIREARLEAFPELIKFHRLRRQGELFSVDDVAAAVADLSAHAAWPSFQNIRLTGRDTLTCLTTGRQITAPEPLPTIEAPRTPLKKSA